MAIIEILGSVIKQVISRFVNWARRTPESARFITYTVVAYTFTMVALAYVSAILLFGLTPWYYTVTFLVVYVLTRLAIEFPAIYTHVLLSTPPSEPVIRVFFTAMQIYWEDKTGMALAASVAILLTLGFLFVLVRGLRHYTRKGSREDCWIAYVCLAVLGLLLLALIIWLDPFSSVCYCAGSDNPSPGTSRFGRTWLQSFWGSHSMPPAIDPHTGVQIMVSHTQNSVRTVDAHCAGLYKDGVNLMNIGDYDEARIKFAEAKGCSKTANIVKSSSSKIIETATHIDYSQSTTTQTAVQAAASAFGTRSAEILEPLMTAGVTGAAEKAGDKAVQLINSEKFKG